MGELKVVYQPDEVTHEPWYILAAFGPCFEVVVELRDSDAQQRRLEGEPAPALVRAMALIDTGASISIIDQRIYELLRPTAYAIEYLKGIQVDRPIEAATLHRAVLVSDRNARALERRRPCRTATWENSGSIDLAGPRLPGAEAI